MKQITTYIYNIKHIKNYINEKLRLTAKRTYTCQPKDEDELKQIITDRIKNEGNECDLNDIDTSKITDMSWLFAAGGTYGNSLFTNFNGDISQWNVSNVENMNYMFCDCKKFNCDISMWNVSNVKDMNFMFCDCKKFNCDLSSWDVSNAEGMNFMFRGCEKFKCNLSSWDVSKVISMYSAFYNCPTLPTWYDIKKWEK